MMHCEALKSASMTNKLLYEGLGALETIYFGHRHDSAGKLCEPRSQLGHVPPAWCIVKHCKTALAMRL
jgi:hypothetical protein